MPRITVPVADQAVVAVQPFWLMSAEVFPNRFRATGASASTVANWSANLLITVTFLSLVDAIGKAWTFWLYAILTGVAILFVWRFIPETKGRPLEHIDEYWREGRWPDDTDAATTTSASGAQARTGRPGRDWQRPGDHARS